MGLIGDYTGTVRGREAKIIHQLTEMLPDLIDAYMLEVVRGFNHVEKANR